MTAREVSQLAATLHALLPNAVITAEPWEEPTQRAVAGVLEGACLEAGVLAIDAAVIADALAGYLGHWSGRYGNLDEPVARAQATLNLAVGGRGDTVYQLLPVGQEVTPTAITTMLGWVLLVDLPEEKEATELP